LKEIDVVYANWGNKIPKEYQEFLEKLREKGIRVVKA
jgi:hydroxymethylpyrimidine pyrophosphatase-like HAD family hydrolase